MKLLEKHANNGIKNNRLLILLLWIHSTAWLILWDHGVLYEQIIIHEAGCAEEMTTMIFLLKST
jgi:hypothetical protein